MSNGEEGHEGDYVVPLGPRAPDKSFPAARISGGSVTVGTMTPAPDGVPVGDRDIVHLEPIEGSPLYEVTVLHKGRQPEHSGPSMVNSREFRSGWDAVFAKKAGAQPN